MKLSEYIKLYRKKTGDTMQQLADRSGLSKGFISQLENDYRPNKSNKEMAPSLETLSKLAHGMNVDLEDILQTVDTSIFLGKTSGQKEVYAFEIPMYGSLCCGDGMFTDDNIIDHIALPSNMINPHKEYFAQMAAGDSMKDLNILDGDILVFEKTSAIDSGKVGCFCIDDNEAMCKQIRVTEKDGIYLMPANDKYDPIRIDPLYENFRCVGVLAFVINDRR